MGYSVRGVVMLVAIALSVGTACAGEELPHIDRDEAFSSVRLMMPLFAQLQQDIGEALSSRRPDAVQEAVNRLVSMVPTIKYGPAHRNMDRLKTMGRVADPFRDRLEEISVQVRYGNYSAADRAFRTARSGCTACHALARDLP